MPNFFNRYDFQAENFQRWPPPAFSFSQVESPSAQAEKNSQEI
jgi:hypothetical protein